MNERLIYDCRFDGNKHVLVLASSISEARKLAFEIVKKQGYACDLLAEITPATAVTFNGESFGLIAHVERTAAA
jgi:hypothetical protein